MCNSGDPQGKRYVLQALEEHTSPTVLELDQLVPAQPALQGERLLGEPGLQSHTSHCGAHAAPGLGPAQLARRVCIITTDWHMVMSR